MRSVLRLNSALLSPFFGGCLLVLMAVVASPIALAQQEIINDYGCAEDVSAVGNCTANEVSLSGVIDVSVTDLDDNPLTECVNGQAIKIETLTADLDSNTGTRYDVTFWIGRLANDPRVASGEGGCAVLSLPDDTGSIFIDDFEGGADTDNCLDFSQPDAPIQLNFGGGGAELTCSDSDNDGMADLQVLSTWWQNKNFFCGAGDDVSPYDFGNPHFSPGAPSKCDFTTIPLVPIISVGKSITKSVTDVGGDGPGGSVDAAGDVISYSLLIENTDTGTLTNVQAGDPLFEGFDQGVDCTPALPASLAQGESATCTGTYTATQADIDNNGGGDGDIDNTAFATSNEVGEVNDSASVPIVQVQNYTITKTVTDVDGGGPGGVVDLAGDVISYQVVVDNAGNTTITGVDVADPLFDGFDSSTDCTPAAPADLAPGESMTCTGQYTVTQNDIDTSGGGDGDIDNTATVSSNELADESDSASVPIAGQPAIRITKTVTDVGGDGPGGLVDAAGDVVSYSVLVENIGAVSLNNVSVSDPLFDAPPVCNPVAPATLAPAESMTCTGSYTVVQQDLDDDGNPTPGSMQIENTATVTSDELPDDSDTAFAPIAASDAYTITKTVTDVGGDGPGGVVDAAGDTISFEITVENTGNTTLNNVDVTDPLIPGLVCNPVAPATLAPAATMTCTGSYDASQGDIDSDGGGDGDIDNTATVSSDELADETDSASVPVAQVPLLGLVKTSTTTLITTVGQVVDYSFVIANNGNVTAEGVTLTDVNLDVMATCVPALGSDLAPGELMNCTGEHTVTASDLLGSTLDNTATANSSTTPPDEDDFSIPVDSPMTPPPVFAPVPVDSKWALVLLILAALAMAWRFAPVRRRS